MKINTYIQYYVEGEDEEKLISVLKTEMQLILPGRVQKFNVIERKFNNAHLMALRPKTIVVLIFDTDTGKDDILKQNIAILKSCSRISQIITIPQVKNLEDELVRCCALKNIKELLGSKSEKDFKRDFMKVTNLEHKLAEHRFDFGKLWRKSPTDKFGWVHNGADNIRR